MSKKGNHMISICLPIKVFMQVDLWCHISTGIVLQKNHRLCSCKSPSFRIITWVLGEDSAIFENIFFKCHSNKELFLSWCHIYMSVTPKGLNVKINNKKISEWKTSATAGRGVILTLCLILYMFLDRMLCMFLRSESRNFFLGLAVIVGLDDFFFFSL